jgi:hypothetical protein
VNASRAAILSLLLLPLVWLWPSVFGGRTFVPYDTAQFPPFSLTATQAQMAMARDGANYDVTEVPVWFLPELELARDELRAGRLPTWNPHARGGAPLHAHGLIGLCYPINWVALTAGEPASRLALVAWLNLALGGLLAFGCLRALGLQVLAAWFGAMLFQLSAPMAVNAFFWMRLASFVWLPGVLWGVLAVARAERLRAGPLAGLAVAFAMTWLAGFPPFAITTSVLGVGFAAWLVLDRARAGFAAARPVALRLALGIGLGAMLAMPQLLPSAKFFADSARQTNPEIAEIAHNAFESYGLLGWLMPDVFSHPSAQREAPYGPQNVLALLWTTRTADGKPALPNFNYTEYALFVGTLGFLLAIVGALVGRGAHRRFAITAWLLCLGLALFVPGVHLLFHLPAIQNVAPMRWLAPATFSIAWLAGLGLERLRASQLALPVVLASATGAATALCAALQNNWAANLTAFPQQAVDALAAKYGVTQQDVVNHVGAPEGINRFHHAAVRLIAALRHAMLCFGAASAWFVLFAWLRTPRSRVVLIGVGAALTIVQLAANGGSVTRGTLRANAPDTPIHAFLRERAAATAASGGFMIARGAVNDEAPAQLPPGQLMVPGIRDLQFYTHFDGRSLQPMQHLLGSHLGTVHAAKGYLAIALPHTLLPPRLATDASVKKDHATAHPFEHPLLDLLGVRYVLSLGADPDGPGPQPLGPLPHTGPVVTIPNGPPGFFVQERTTALPRAFAIDRVQPAATDDDVVRALLAADFAPGRVAHALASDLPADLPPAPQPDAPRRTVVFTTDLPTHVELDVGAGAQPWLLLTDTFLAGWQATIDGTPTEIVRADHAFRAVRLPQAACRVTFTYTAPGLAAGLWLAFLATVALVVSAFATRRGTATPSGSS